ncbi:hypothetical protein [Candidatus Chloroploca asiatica]|uniref:hypothetical protein n=1 Tax=Candidatus Chloroploca asiatica TaxID=1506545 RepID=UPI00114379CC|nr:hypothetical protein [Candidatus Chloroploca asiatica]
MSEQPAIHTERLDAVPLLLAHMQRPALPHLWIIHHPKNEAGNGIIDLHSPPRERWRWLRPSVSLCSRLILGLRMLCITSQCCGEWKLQSDRKNDTKAIYGFLLAILGVTNERCTGVRALAETTA